MAIEIARVSNVGGGGSSSGGSSGSSEYIITNKGVVNRYTATQDYELNSVTVEIEFNKELDFNHKYFVIDVPLINSKCSSFNVNTGEGINIIFVSYSSSYSYNESNTNPALTSLEDMYLTLMSHNGKYYFQWGSKSISADILSIYASQITTFSLYGFN